VVLSVRDLKTIFRTDDAEVKAVDGVSFDVRRGATLCIVGESGSGKSATARSILQVVDNPGLVESGQILYRRGPDDRVIDIAALDPRGAALRTIRGGDIGLVFQEPMSSLSPVHTIGDQIVEVLRLHDPQTPAEMRARAIDELGRVGIPEAEERFGAYTFQLSGGMRQRAMIAMALVTRPALLIADEPTTALDVTTQAQILQLLADLKSTLGMTMIFITHDLGVVAEIADDVIVMRHGTVVEAGPVDGIFHDPQHPYTRQLLATLPQRSTLGGWAAASKNTPERPSEPTTAPILEIEHLDVTFSGSSGRIFGGNRRAVHAVKDLSLAIPAGSTMGLVGESGSGKTTLGRCVLRAYQPDSGAIRYHTDGGTVDLARLTDQQLAPYRREIRMIFQDPYGSLNPRLTVRQVIGDPLRAAGVERAEIDARVAQMLDLVGLRPDMASRYPHAFSGGERQRIGIARALITRPRLVVADEAVSALDVSVRGQILELLADLQSELGLTYLFISHDLSVVERICDRVAVMFHGQIVEEAKASDIFTAPTHEYTKALLSAIPLPDPRLRGTRELLTYRPTDDMVSV
jgi:peptide/nickel transport system ATP-binding protein